MNILKQSTAVTLLIGPFVDETDGKTAEGGLAIAQADVRLSKNAGNMAQKAEVNACTHDEIGYYTCPIDGTDTNTLGYLKVMVHEGGALPVWHEYMVVPANVYDSVVLGTDYLQADTVEISGTAQTANDVGGDVDAILTDTGTTLDGIVDAILVDTGTTLQGELDAIQAAVITNAAGVDIAADIIAVKAETAAIVNDTDVIDDGTSGLVKIAQDVAAVLVDTGTTLDGAISTVDGNVDAILVDTNELQTDNVPGLIGALNDPTAVAIRTEIDSNSTQLSAIVTDTNELQTDNVPGLIGALNNVSTAEVNAQVVDVMTVDVLADSISADGSRPTIGQALIEINRFLQERAVAATTVSVKKEDGTTEAFTLTLNDATTPTSITRAT